MEQFRVLRGNSRILSVCRIDLLLKSLTCHVSYKTFCWPTSLSLSTLTNFQRRRVFLQSSYFFFNNKGQTMQSIAEDYNITYAEYAIYRQRCQLSRFWRETYVFFASPPALPLFTSTINIEHLVRNKTDFLLVFLCHTPTR